MNKIFLKKAIPFLDITLLARALEAKARSKSTKTPVKPSFNHLSRLAYILNNHGEFYERILRQLPQGQQQ